MADHDTTPFQVISDRPVELHNPVGRARLALALLALAILLAAGAGGWGGYELAARRIDARVSALERDQQQRTAARSAQIEQLRTTACVILNRLPPDPDVDRQRQLFGCGPYVPQPASSPRSAGSAGPGAPPGPLSTGGGPAPPAQPGAPPTPQPPRPTPSPQPRPVPSPTPGGGLRVCLPILGCLL